MASPSSWAEGATAKGSVATAAPHVSDGAGQARQGATSTLVGTCLVRVALETCITIARRVSLKRVHHIINVLHEAATVGRGRGTSRGDAGAACCARIVAHAHANAVVGQRWCERPGTAGICRVVQYSLQ